MGNVPITATVLTGPGIGALAVVRLIGPEADLNSLVLKATSKAPPPPGQVRVRSWFGNGHQPVDELLLARLSPTCLELHTHGGLAISHALRESLTADGVTWQGPAESLATAEADGTASPAETVDRHLRTLLRNARSARVAQLVLAQPAAWVAWLDRLLALDPVTDAAQRTAMREAVLERLPLARAVELPPEVRLVGAPNVGKSTLANALGRRGEVHLTSPVAGTTRDSLETLILVAEMPVRLTDAPGLRPSDDPVERRGVRQALASWRQPPDAALVLTNAAEPPDKPTLAELYAQASQRAPVAFLIGTHADLPSHAHWHGDIAPADRRLLASGTTGQGLDALRERLAIALRLDPAADTLDPLPLWPILPQLDGPADLLDALRSGLRSFLP